MKDNHLHSKNVLLHGSHAVGLVAEVERKSLHLKEALVLINILLLHLLEGVHEHLDHSVVQLLLRSSQTRDISQFEKGKYS